MLRRRLFLAGPLLLAAAPALGQTQKRKAPPPTAQPIVWSTADAARFAAIRQGFPEYSGLADREFAGELLDRVRRVWLASPQEQRAFYQTFVQRLPWYDIYSVKGLHDELIRLLLTAYTHFSHPP